MKKLIAVENAKTLLNEAKDWSVWKWLLEKRRVRQTADRAWEALDQLEATIREGWSEDLKAAYDELVMAATVNGDASARRRYQKARQKAEAIDPAVKETARRIWEADDEAYRARMHAEEIFDHAERRLDTGMAREGAARAVEAWTLREKFIRRAEAAAKAEVAH